MYGEQKNNKRRKSEISCLSTIPKLKENEKTTNTI